MKSHLGTKSPRTRLELAYDLLKAALTGGALADWNPRDQAWPTAHELADAHVTYALALADRVLAEHKVADE